MAAGVINVLANIVLGYYFQSTGTVWAILLTESFITFFVMSEIRRVEKNTGHADLL
jgi:hypothetical protein